MIDDQLPDHSSPWPGVALPPNGVVHRPGARGIRSEAAPSWAADLQQAAADRMPITARRWRPRVTPRAAVAALLVLVAISVIVMARAHATDAAAVTVPPRALQHGTRSGSSDPSAPTPATPPVPAGPVVTVPGAGPAVTMAGAGVPAGTVSGATGPAGVVSGTSGPLGILVVDVTGRVHRPGLVRLPAGARVWDAVVAAGGASSQARLDGLNLARPLSDGEQIRVPGPGDPTPADPGPPIAGGQVGAVGAATGASRAPVDLNSATAADLDALPGVGPVLAGRILTWRAQHGRFSRVEELGEVQGIGQKLFATLRSLVRV